MRKSTIFISAVLTTFALVMLYGVVSAYQSMSNTPAAATLVANDTATPEPTLEPAATPDTPDTVTPEQAAQIAAQVVGNTNLLSAESSTFNGLNAYLITFTNKDVVYVGLDGQILGVQIAPVVVNISAPAPAKYTNKDKNKDNSSHNDSSISNSSMTESQAENQFEHED